MLRSRWLIAVALISCGGEVPALLPPNTVIACDRVVECGAIAADRVDQCVACLETVADKWNEQAVEYFGEGNVPELDSLACDLVADLATKTNLATCAAAGWWGP